MCAQDAEDMRAGRMDKAQQPRCIMWARTTLLPSLLRTEYRHLQPSPRNIDRNAAQALRGAGLGASALALDGIGARRPKTRGWAPDDGWVHDVMTLGTPHLVPAAAQQRRKKSGFGAGLGGEYGVD